MVGIRPALDEAEARSLDTLGRPEDAVAATRREQAAYVYLGMRADADRLAGPPLQPGTPSTANVGSGEE